MSVKYQVDGDIFQEIVEKWLSVHVREFLIIKRTYETDQTGNRIENFQLNDGRIFSRHVLSPQADTAVKSGTHARAPRFAT